MGFLINFNAGRQNIPAGKYTLHIERSGDDRVRESKKYDLSEVSGTIRFTTSSSHAGFVRVLAVIKNEKGDKIGGDRQIFDGGAGVDIEKLRPAAEEPVDFDKFWAAQKKRLTDLPIKAERTLINDPDSQVLIYAVKVNCAGPRPLTGYLTIPKSAPRQSMPVLINYEGYSTLPQQIPQGGDRGKIIFFTNAHGYDLNQCKKYYKTFFEKIKSNGEEYGFDPVQNKNPETAYFNGMALRVMRSLQYVKTLPEWDGKNLIVTGGSQGGLQTVWAAALDEDVSIAYPSVIWCCDLAGGSKLNRLRGWAPAYVPALDYYDPVFHARRIKCPTHITRAGLGDYISPPSGLAIVYNMLECPKSILWMQSATHGYIPQDAQKFKIENSKSGKRTIRRGFMVSDIEKETAETVRREWNANLVRLQLIPLFWAAQKNISPADAWKWLMKKLPDWLDNAKAEGLTVVIDLHNIPKQYAQLPQKEALQRFWNDPAARQMFLDCWREIAVICQHRSEEIWFDLLNEPLNWDDMPSYPEKWPKWAQQCILEIRKIDKNHHIVIEPGPGGLSWGFKDFPLLHDPSDKLIYSTHQYQPHAYTMQGIEDITGTDLAQAYLKKGLRWPGIFSDSGGGYWDKKRLEEKELAHVIEFQKKHKVRIYIGEFSVARWAPDAAQYLDDCISIFEKYGWDWSYHAFRENHIWSLEHENTRTPDPQKSALPTKRARVIKKYFKKNQFENWTEKIVNTP